MSADWKAGDRALCVRDDWDLDKFRKDFIESVPTKGCVYLVTETVIDPRGEIGLFLSGCRSTVGRTLLKFFRIKTTRGRGWSAMAFRKIVPACDRAEISEKNSQPETR